MASFTKENNSRPLGPQETLFHHLTHKYNASVYIHAAVINSSHELSPEDVRKAFLILAEHQETLRMKIVPDENEHLSYKFIPMEDPTQLNIRVTKLKSKSDWPAMVADQSLHQIDSYNGPLWKVVVANVETIEEDDVHCKDHQNIVFLELHHAIGDGTSGFDVLYRQFLPILSALVNKGDADSLAYMSLTKSTEELFGLKRGKGTNKIIIPWRKKLALDLLRYKNRNESNKYVYEKNFMFPDEPKRSFSDILREPICKPVLFSRDLTSCIIKAAKSKGVSVHSVLLGVSSIALCATSEEAGVELPESIRQTWAINLRKQLGLTSPHPLGLHISLGHTKTMRKVEYTLREFWEMCFTIYDEIKQQKLRQKVISSLECTQYFLNETTNHRLHVVMTECGTSLASISNLGNCDTDPEPILTDGEVKLELIEHHFTVTGVGIFHDQPFLHGVSTFKGRMNWNTTYDKKIISQRFMDRYLQKIQEGCQKYCGELAATGTGM